MIHKFNQNLQLNSSLKLVHCITEISKSDKADISHCSLVFYTLPYTLILSWVKFILTCDYCLYLSQSPSVSHQLRPQASLYIKA